MLRRNPLTAWESDLCQHASIGPSYRLHCLSTSCGARTWYRFFVPGIQGQEHRKSNIGIAGYGLLDKDLESQFILTGLEILIAIIRIYLRDGDEAAKSASQVLVSRCAMCHDLIRTCAQHEATNLHVKSSDQCSCSCNWRAMSRAYNEKSCYLAVIPTI